MQTVKITITVQYEGNVDVVELMDNMAVAIEKRQIECGLTSADEDGVVLSVVLSLPEEALSQ